MCDSASSCQGETHRGPGSCDLRQASARATMFMAGLYGVRFKPSDGFHGDLSLDEKQSTRQQNVGRGQSARNVQPRA